MLERTLFVVYGIFLIVGGYFGWRAGSKISLIMGLASGALVLISTSVLVTYPKAGYIALTIIGGILSVSFLMRYLKTHAIFPSGVFCLLSFIFFVFCLTRLLSR